MYDMRRATSFAGPNKHPRGAPLYMHDIDSIKLEVHLLALSVVFTRSRPVSPAAFARCNAGSNTIDHVCVYQPTCSNSKLKHVSFAMPVASFPRVGSYSLILVLVLVYR